MEIRFNLSKYHRKENDPLFKDGKLCLYTDTKSEDYPDEVIEAFADTLIDYYHLHSLDKITERMNKFKLHSLNIEINQHLSISFAEIDQRVFVYEEYDMYTDTKIELTEEQKECNVLCGEFNKLFDRICDVIHRKTGFWCNRNRYSYSAYWHVAVSKYSTENITSSMGQKMLSVLNGGDIFTIRIENENGELFLPTYEPILVDYDFIAPARAINASGFNGLGFTFKKSGKEYTPYLDNLGYTGRIVITKQDLTKLNNRTDVVTNTSINVDYVEEGNSDNTIYDGIYSNETKGEVINILSENTVYYTGPLPNTYINNNVVINIGTDAIYRKDEIFEVVKKIANNYTSKQQEANIDFKGVRLVDFKGELITVSELLDRISEEEFLSLLNTYAYNHNTSIVNISREQLNNGNIVYYNHDRLSGRQFNKFFENNVYEDKLEKLSSAECEKFIAFHPTVYAIRRVNRNRNIIRVEVDDNGNRIAAFKKCDLIINSEEELSEYLHDIRNVGFGGGYDSNVSHYGATINLSIDYGDGNVVEPYDIYRHKETGQYFIARKANSFYYPIPLNFKFD